MPRLFFVLLSAFVELISCKNSSVHTQPPADTTHVDTMLPAAPRDVAEKPVSFSYNSIKRKHWFLQQLSKQFDVDINVVRFVDSIQVHDSTVVSVLLRDKISKAVFDSVGVVSKLFYTRYFDGKNFCSYSTKFSLRNEHVDNYYGDVIAADFNFDGMDDLAIINDEGGNSGPNYSFFTRGPAKQFLPDQYLTDSVYFFPDKINRKGRTLTTYGHAGACCVGEHVFQLGANGKWSLKSYRLLR